MNYAEFKAIMDQINIPHTYYSFPEKKVPKPPYFVWYFQGSNNFGADDVVYAEILEPVIELYSPQKSFEDELTIEALLNASELFWNKSDSYIESERMHMTVYEIGEIIHGE